MKNISLYARVILLAVILLLAGCQPTGQILTTATASATATLPPTPYPITPSPTPIATLTVQPTSDLAAAQLQRLYEASLNYLAQTDTETWQVARSLGYAPLGGYPSNMCGPLAISILQDAGIVSQAADLHDFWLLNPEEDGQLLQNTFPVEHFKWLHSDQPIDQIDYSQFPLRAGDLVYIYSGYQGDYSHVLAVTRVDADGRAYSVTNNFTEAGFVVLEYLLYDPTVPGNGIFYAWPDPANQELGLTGFGSMDIWSPISLPYYADGLP